MSDYYDRSGEPISYERYAELHADFDYVSVGRQVALGHMVSTVWLGLDHRHSLSERPAIFETMVFPAAGNEPSDWTEIYCERYATEEQAKAGHERVLANLEAILKERGVDG